jgi:A/G-specific adenine glycosylase
MDDNMLVWNSGFGLDSSFQNLVKMSFGFLGGAAAPPYQEFQISFVRIRIKIRSLETSKQNLRVVERLLKWFGENARDLPWRRTRDPYAIWISEIMLQQTQVKTVTAYWERWMRALPDAPALARAKPALIYKLWEGLGYYARVRNAQAAARVMVEKHDGRFPGTFTEALALPGVGRYTAGAVCSIAYNLPTPILDGNVTRVLCRVFGVEGDPQGKETNGRLWGLAEELVGIADPPSLRYGAASCGAAKGRNCGRLNEALMELGALVCTARTPRCGVCPLRRMCFARREDRVAEFPAAKAKGRMSRQRFAALIVRRNGRFLARQRPAGGVNAELWEFPNVEVALSGSDLAAAVAPFVLTGRRALCRVRHSITRHRILLEAYGAELPEKEAEAHGVWRTRGQLERLAMTSAHRKILTALR